MRTIYKQEFVKAVVSGTVKGIIVVSIILWGIRSTFIEVNIKRILLETEREELFKASNRLLEQQQEMKGQYDVLSENYQLLMKQQEYLKAENDRLMKQLHEKTLTPKH